MTIQSDVQKLEPGDIVYMYVLDLSHYNAGIFRFHSNYTNNSTGELYWQGETYVSFPITSSGFEKSVGKEMPRPTVTVSNVLGVMSSILQDFDDLVGCKLVRKSTYVKYLDKENFTGSVNATEDPNQHFPDEVWSIYRKTAEDKYTVSFELSAEWDVQDKQIPARPCSATLCSWSYRGPDCGYSGGPVADINDNPTTALANDVCGKRYSSCVLRYGSGILPWGGFLGVGIIR